MGEAGVGTRMTGIPRIGDVYERGGLRREVVGLEFTPLWGLGFWVTWVRPGSRTKSRMRGKSWLEWASAAKLLGNRGYYACCEWPRNEGENSVIACISHKCFVYKDFGSSEAERPLRATGAAEFERFSGRKS